MGILPYGAGMVAVFAELCDGGGIPGGGGGACAIGSS